MRVGFLIDRWDPRRGGAERALALYAAHLEAHGHEVLAFARAAAPDAPGEFHRVDPGGWMRSVRERRLASALLASARDARCDVTIGVRHLSEVDLYWPHGGAHAATLAARRRSRGERVDAPARGRHATFLEFERELLERGGARRIACVSQLVQDELARAWPACVDRLRLVENGIDLERFHPRERERSGAELRRRLELDARTPLLAFAARDAELKGLPALLSALARLRERPWSLCVAGPLDRERWQARARALDLGERVVVHSELDPVALWCAADLCVHPTWRDTSGLVVLEALACGTPVITTRCAGAAELVGSERACSVLDDPGDDAALAREIERWLDSIERDPPDRELVRASVRERGLAPWLAKLDALVEELAT